MVKTVQDCISEGESLFLKHSLFFGHGTNNAADEALWIVFHILQIPWDSNEDVLKREVSTSDWQRIETIFTRRVEERIPTAYLLNSAWFAGYEFIVNSDVLVPRSPIAELIHVGYSPWLDNTIKGPKILDLCTGSGCIGIASALSLENALITLSDISPSALMVAEQNIQKYTLQDRVTTIESDLFNRFEDKQFDLIVSNPPYVDAKDFGSMPDEYHAEPALGLTSGDDGLDFTRRLLVEAPNYLSDQGVLICELGNSWVNLEAAFPKVPFMWLELERGAHGIFVFNKQELLTYRREFAKSLK
jgi:ribosomal protein L3 glutamine methyltransferase